jgi:hypothetical protein
MMIDFILLNNTQISFSKFIYLLKLYFIISTIFILSNSLKLYAIDFISNQLNILFTTCELLFVFISVIVIRIGYTEIAE